jgi:hypothetical protein
MKYDFTVVLKDSPELTCELADKLFAAGCDDGSPGMCAGVTSIDFHRNASSLEEPKLCRRREWGVTAPAYPANSIHPESRLPAHTSHSNRIGKLFPHRAGNT